MRILKKISGLLVLFSSTLMAGEYADAFLLANLHPQVYSLGFSTVASPVHAGHAMNNPAGFVHGPAHHISLVYEQFNDLTQSVGLEAKYKVSDKYDLGLTLINNSVSDLQTRPNLSNLTPQSRRDSVLALAGVDSDIIDYRESAVFLTLAREFKFYIDLGWVYFKIPCRVPLGVSVKYIDKILVENRGIGSGVDAGAQFFFNLGGMSDLFLNTDFSFGLVINDALNTPVFWDSEHQDAIKRHSTFGVSIDQSIKKYDTVISISRARQERYDNDLQYGLQVKVRDMVSVRLGNNGTTTSFGLGISLKKFIIDYSFSRHELSDMQKIGINYQF